MTNKRKVMLTLFCLIGYLVVFCQTETPALWYSKPAKTWTEALPVGNGRLGAMIYGDYLHENIQLNEESVWAGSKTNNNNPQARAHLGEIQQAIFHQEYNKALDLANNYMVGTPPRIRSYQPLGNLFINYQWKTEPTVYKRSLNLHNGIAKSEYAIDGNKVTQEVFVSAPQDIIVISINAEMVFNADVLLSREYDNDNENKDKRKKSDPPFVPFYTNIYKNEKGMAFYTGQIVDAEEPNKGLPGKHMRYAATMKILSVDGKIEPIITNKSTGFHLQSVKNIVLVITGATDYNLKKLDTDPQLDPLGICKTIIAKAEKFKPSQLKVIHTQDHQLLFDRVKFSLCDDELKSMATDERLARMKEGKSDQGLITLYYQYGRYLLMNSSRKPGRLPANLQGIWNDLYDAPWNADFHTNINLQMNYWPAETGNLPETVIPLSGFMRELTTSGAVTAKEMYNAGGWTMHHLTDPFGVTGVMDGVWGITPLDGSWMTFALYDHYEFTQDMGYLRNVAYPMIKGSVSFVLDYLIKSPEGFLVTNPSHSPENVFYVPNTNPKEKSQLCYMPTVDIHIVNALFNNFTQAARKLNVDAGLVKQVKDAQKLLPPLQVSANGTLQEWIKDYEEVEPGHRHISHLLGLYPLNLISPNDTVYFQAAKKTLERRLANGGGHTGWSKAWIVSLFARLLEPEKALENLNELLRKSTLTNLFDTHPPFQIDGNFGGTAAIAEMLLQSQNGEIHLLPAVPAAWSEGSIHGLRSRGACTVNIDWKGGALTKVSIKSDQGGSYVVRYKEKLKQIRLHAGETIQLDGFLN
ncbi:MAG: glycoside hydrolase family 95 protein [Saprospiraceae bacterium]